MRLFLTHEGWVHGLTLTSVDDHLMTLTSTPPINQTLPHSTRPGMRPLRDSPCDQPYDVT